MKLQNTTIGLLVIALLLGGGVYWLEASRRPTTPQSAAPAEAKQIFKFQEGQVKSVKIQFDQRTLSFIKLAANPAKPDQVRWQMLAPEVGPAEEASLAYLLNLLATGTASSHLTVSPAQLREFGLEKPRATVTVVLDNQTQHQLVLGKADFSEQFIFAQADPPTTQQATQVLVVPKAFMDAVDRPLSEWRKQ